MGGKLWIVREIWSMLGKVGLGDIWYYVFVLIWGKRTKIFPQIFFFSSFIERNERDLVGLEGSEGEVVSGYKETTLATSLQFVFGSARDNITCRPDNSWPWWLKYVFSHSFPPHMCYIFDQTFSAAALPSASCQCQPRRSQTQRKR